MKTSALGFEETASEKRRRELDELAVKVNV